MKSRERHSFELPVSSNTPIHHHEDNTQHWKKWQYLVPRWSSPDLSSTTSTTATASVVSQQDKHCDWNDEHDEEKTIGDADHDHHMDEEEALEHVSKALSLHATFIFIPGIMMMTFYNTPIDQSTTATTMPLFPWQQCYCHSQTILVRCPQGFDMGKLTKVNHIIQCMCSKQEEENHMSVTQSIQSLQEIFQDKPTWNVWITLISHTLSSLFTALIMFNGTLIDTALSGALGLLVGLLIILSERYTAYCNIFEISTTVLIAFIAKALDQWICFTGVVLSATSILIPGYTLTMSIMELSARHVITGTVRFVYAMIYALFIGYGLEIGTSLYEAVDAHSSPSVFDVCKGHAPSWLHICLFPLMAISMSINLGATMRQWPSMVCSSAIGFGVSVLSSKVITNFQIVGTISAFSVGLFGNFYFKLTGDLALVPLSCGIASLVPGSIGIQGAYFLIRQDDQGISFATQMVVASLGIAVGLFAATLAVSASERKRAAYLSY
ncbi:hypothetical protein MAM1_0019d01724 [Mucor ambiguus]|uniref:Threonine/serine exporter-like N-terminal domain-containing protein n=1 Tax=Mucor ambiguus TaxID=91626 RepID=A0A0C9MGU9_9FUNG|nr:hypothetical protein MAM1_0019d01724 [Mucor ambiguus]